MRFTIHSRNQIKSNVCFSGEGKIGVPGEKPLGAEYRTNKLSPHMKPSPGIEPGPHWWEASALPRRQPCFRTILTSFCAICCLHFREPSPSVSYKECFLCTERFHITSRQPYSCIKTMKRRPCWCTKLILW